MGLRRRAGHERNSRLTSHAAWRHFQPGPWRRTACHASRAAGTGRRAGNCSSRRRHMSPSRTRRPGDSGRRTGQREGSSSRSSPSSRAADRPGAAPAQPMARPAPHIQHARSGRQGARCQGRSLQRRRAGVGNSGASRQAFRGCTASSRASGITRPKLAVRAAPSQGQRQRKARRNQPRLPPACCPTGLASRTQARSPPAGPPAGRARGRAVGATPRRWPRATSAGAGQGRRMGRGEASVRTCE